MFQEYWHFGEGLRVVVRVRRGRKELRLPSLQFETVSGESSELNDGTKEEESH